MKGRIYSLDAIRGLGACTIAFLWHYQHFNPHSGYPFGNILRIPYSYGWLFVEMFFMLSGFGIAHGYRDRLLNKSLGFKDFFGKRFKRLYPLFFITLIITTILEFINIIYTGSTFQYSNFDFYHFILNLLCIQSGWIENSFSFNAPSWCISVILFCNIIYYIITRIDKFIYILGCIGTSVIGILAFLLEWDYPFLGKNFMARGLVCFFVGVILHEIYNSLSEKNIHILGYISVSVVILIILVTIINGIKFWGNFQLLCMLILFPFFIFSVLGVEPLKKFLEFKPLIFLGKCAFSIYLWHYPIQCIINLLNLIFNFNYFSYSVYFLYICMTLACSFLSYFFIECKLSRLWSKNCR